MRINIESPLFLALACAAAALLVALWAGLSMFPGPYSVRTLEEDHRANYERIFGTPPPLDVEVVHSVLFEYEYEGPTNADGGGSDWEIELLAPRTWIEQTVAMLPLSGPFEASLDDNLTWRQEHRYREWYAPKPMDTYEGYKMTLTSIPDQHLLVERVPQPDGRFRAFVSKH